MTILRATTVIMQQFLANANQAKSPLADQGALDYTNYGPTQITGSINTSGVMTTTAVTGNPVAVGQVITGTGVPAGCTVTSGGGTTWNVSPAPASNVSSESLYATGPGAGGLFSFPRGWAPDVLPGNFFRMRFASPQGVQGGMPRYFGGLFFPDPYYTDQVQALGNLLDIYNLKHFMGPRTVLQIDQNAHLISGIGVPLQLSAELAVNAQASAIGILEALGFTTFANPTAPVPALTV